MIYPPPKAKLQESEPVRALNAGPGARVVKTPFGRSISVMGGSKWHHPWFTRLTWVAGIKKWVATVRPGFVNGQAPVVLVTAEEQAQIEISGGYDFGINPVSGAKFSSVYIFNLNKTAKEPVDADTTTLPTPLYYNPAISLRWEALGWDGARTVPTFFQNKGVGLPPKGVSAGEDFNPEPMNVADMTPPKGNRLLRAASIILHQPRMALTSTITLEPGILTGISNATQTLGLRSAGPGDMLKIFSGKMVDTFATDIDPLAGDYEEPNFDELLISTVYLLSPPDCPPGSEPDATWEPFVKHSLFWNLDYLTPAFEITVADLSNPFASLTQIASVLGGGTGSIAVNFVAAGLNDMARNALNMINAHSMAGTFYTATGGGSTSVFPPVPAVPATPAQGLDKAANQVAQRLAEQRAKLTETLDPVFPFEGRQFPSSYLT